MYCVAWQSVLESRCPWLFANFFGHDCTGMPYSACMSSQCCACAMRMQVAPSIACLSRCFAEQSNAGINRVLPSPFSSLPPCLCLSHEVDLTGGGSLHPQSARECLRGRLCFKKLENLPYRARAHRYAEGKRNFMHVACSIILSCAIRYQLSDPMNIDPKLSCAAPPSSPDLSWALLRPFCSCDLNHFKSCIV